MASGKLLTYTLELVRNRPRHETYEQISKKARVPLRFLQLLMQGKVKCPDVNRIERLYVYFAKKPVI